MRVQGKTCAVCLQARWPISHCEQCEECEYCGEQYFKAEALKEIEKDFMDIYFSKKKTRRKINVPVEECLEI